VSTLVVLGLNHKRAPVALRERAAIPSASLAEALTALKASGGFSEAFIISTCNRIELYAATEDSHKAKKDLVFFLCDYREVPEADVTPHVYFHAGREAVRHLFRVAASLDSMVVGETQVIAQVKEAYVAASAAGTVGPVLHPLLQKALHAAKRAHAETAIGERKVSVSSVAVDFAQRVFQRMENRTTLVLGAGETAELVVTQLVEEGVKRFVVANRDRAKAEALASARGGRAIDLAEALAALREADVVISCLGVETPFVLRDHVARAIAERRGQPIFLLDLGVPRNIDPTIAELDGAFLYTIDDLQTVVLENIAEREKEMSKCEAILDHEVATAAASMGGSDISPVISTLYDTLHALGREEVERSRGRLRDLSPAQQEEVGEIVRRLVNRILHPPMAALKEGNANGEAEALAASLRRLFRLR